MSYYSAAAGIQVATQAASTVFYPFTDHNRQPMNESFDVIENAQRMADGTMRKFVVAKKRNLEVSWNDLPSATYAPTASGYLINSWGFESGTTGWTQQANTTISQSSTQKHSGTYSMRLAPTAAGLVAVISAQQTASAGLLYGAKAYFRATTATRTSRLFLTFYDSTNTQLGQTITSITSSSTTWTLATVQGVAPLSTSYALVYMDISGTTGSSDYQYIDDVSYYLANNSFNTSGYPITVDGYPGAAWIRSFYNDNLFKPVRVRFTNSQDNWSSNSASAFLPSPNMTAYEEFWAFMTNFKYDVVKRYTLTDIVNVGITFVEV